MHTHLAGSNHRRWLLIVVAMALVAVGCGSSSTGGPAVDIVDGSTSDTGVGDTGAGDTVGGDVAAEDTDLSDDGGQQPDEDGAAPLPDLDCRAYYDCIAGCPPEDAACTADCAARLTPLGATQVQALDSCVAESCGHCTAPSAPADCHGECAGLECTVPFAECMFADGTELCGGFLDCLESCNHDPDCELACHDTVSPTGYIDAVGWTVCISEACPICETGDVEGCNECIATATSDGCSQEYGRCLSGCEPNCINRDCGDDGCGASCGTCPAGQQCGSDGTCAEPSQVKIVGATLSQQVEHIERFGDSWMTTWADDDSVFFTWGDATALRDCYPIWGAPPDPPTCDVIPSCPAEDVVECMFEWLYCDALAFWGAEQQCGPDQCFEPCRITDLGLLRLEGSPPQFNLCNPFESCLVARNIPSGQELLNDEGTDQVDRNDKPSSLLFLDGRLVLAGHNPPLYAVAGWLAYSEDYGKTWTEVPDSPWQADSPFRVLMMFNMGQAYEWNTDGFIYAFGIGFEAGWTKDPKHHGHPDAEEKTVYLARVPRASLLDYGAWRYFSGLDAGNEPTWSESQGDAVPLDNIETQETGSPIYHPWTDRCLFLAAGPGALWQAPHPWGPWSKVADLFNESPGGTWAQEGYLPSIITKDMGADHFYFAISGNVEGYYLKIRRIDLQTDSGN